MPTLSGGLIPISSLPAEVRLKLGISIPTTKGAELDPQPPRTNWQSFWPYAIDVLRKYEEKEGITKAKQTVLMKFAGTLKKKPYTEWTPSDIISEYKSWVPPANEECEKSVNQVKLLEKEKLSKKTEVKAKKTTKEDKANPVQPVGKEKKVKKPKKKEEVTLEPPIPPTPLSTASPSRLVDLSQITKIPLPASPPDTETEFQKEPIHTRRKNIPKHIKTLVWNKYIGSAIATAKCVCCRQEDIKVQSFHCGHVLAESKGGDMTINNLRPICAPCNLSMGTRSMNEFTSEFFGWTV
jgi:hypothetical protein